MSKSLIGHIQCIAVCLRSHARDMLHCIASNRIHFRRFTICWCLLFFFFSLLGLFMHSFVFRFHLSTISPHKRRPAYTIHTYVICVVCTKTRTLKENYIFSIELFYILRFLTLALALSFYFISLTIALFFVRVSW